MMLDSAIPEAECQLVDRRQRLRGSRAEKISEREQEETRSPVIMQHQTSGKSQFSSFILFAGLIILLNLCPPFQIDDELHHQRAQDTPASKSIGHFSSSQREYLNYFESGLEFVKLMFRNPMRMEARTTRYTLAEARVLGKMAKVWYIKKKIKKLSKKLKKHTIAVPVFTAIPIYEHSYYPQPHVTHVTHGGHHAAASSYSPSVAQLTSGASGSLVSSAGQQMTAAASNQHAAAYKMAPPPGHHGHHHHMAAMYHPHGSGSHHIINAYTPSQPLFVDDAGGLYGHYGNAYGRYDGGYHIW